MPFHRKQLGERFLLGLLNSLIQLLAALLDLAAQFNDLWLNYALPEFLAGRGRLTTHSTGAESACLSSPACA